MKEIRRNTINQLRTLARETKPNGQRKTYVLASVRPKHKESKIVTNVLSSSYNAEFERRNVKELVTRFIVPISIISDKGNRVTLDF